MKKTTKIIMIIFMILGITFSISNCISIELTASKGMGEKGI